MKMFIRFVFFFLFLGFMRSPLVATPAPNQRDRLVQGLGALALDGSLWKNTYNPGQREQLYEPINYATTFRHKDYSATLFFMRSSKLGKTLPDLIDTHVVQDSLKKVIEYLFLTDPRYVSMTIADVPATFEPTEDEEDRIDDYINYLVDVDSLKLAKDICAQFDKMTFQEHRLGVGIEKEWRWDCWCAGIRTWAGLAERNFWLSGEDRKTIAAYLAQAFPDLDAVFNPADFIQMSWGIGDTHLKLGYVHPITQGSELRVGLRIILPTGRKPERSTQYSLVPVKADEIKEYLFSRAKEIMIEPAFSNGGHYGIGLWTHLQSKARQQLTMHVYGGFDYLFKTYENRFFMSKVTQKTISTSNSDEQIRQFMHQYLVPRAVSIEVAPGLTVNAGTLAQWHPGKWCLYGGYDFFYKDPDVIERFQYVNDAAAYISGPSTTTLAKRQHKIVGGVVYDTQLRNANVLFHTFETLDVSFKIGGTTSLLAHGLGQDFSLAIGLGVVF